MTPVKRDILIGLVLVAAACALPFLFPGRYIVTQATLFFIWAVVVVQWNLVLGVGGIFSLAQMVCCPLLVRRSGAKGRGRTLCVCLAGATLANIGIAAYIRRRGVLMAIVPFPRRASRRGRQE